MNTDPATVREVFASHYFLFAFLASLGTMQVSASISGIRGLWLTPHQTVTRRLGIALIVTGVVIFFAQPLWTDGPWAAGTVEADSISRGWGQANWSELAGARNVNDIHGGLDGTKQAIWYPLAVVLAFVVSAMIGAVNVRILTGAESPDERPPDDVDGLGGLANRSYFSNLPISWRNFRSEITGTWRSGLATADAWSLFRMIFGRSPK
jgi:hypothetical protein